MALRCLKCSQELPGASPSGALPACPACGSAIAVPHPQAPTLQYADGTPPMRTGDESTAASRGEWDTLPDGTMVGPYRIVGPLGQGGMGTVYKAMQPGLDRTVALKLLPAQLARDPDFVARFHREARTLGALSHPNIVGVFEFGSAGDHYYFCMEFVDGRTLRSLLRERRLTQEEVLRLLPQVLDALAYAHGEGVVHRDIKPENVLLDRRGRAKIADFGLARIVRGEKPLEPLTRTNTVMGTVEYMAPEQRESSRDVDHRVDLYSLGVMLYEMLTGKLPVGRWELPSREVGCDPRLDAVLLRCLEHDPRKRWSGAQEILAELAPIALAPGSGVASGLVLPHQRPSDAAPGVALPAELPAERREAVAAIAEALGPLGFVRHEKTLPATVPLDAVFTRTSPETSYLVAVAPWPATQPATPDNLRVHAGMVRAGILGLLADADESESRVLSVAFTGFADELSDEFAAGLKKLVDRTGFHDLTIHGALALDARGGKVHYQRSAFAYWALRDVPDRLHAAARAACESIARHRSSAAVARTAESRGSGRLGHVESALLAAGYQRVWWHESRPGIEVLGRAWLRAGSGEQVQLAVFRDLPPDRVPDRRWVQNQADLVRAAIHTVAPSLKWQEYLVTLCVGGRGALDAVGERALGRAINSLRLDAVSIQAVAYVPEQHARAFFQASMSPHYYGLNQTVEAVRATLKTLPRPEEAAPESPTVVVATPVRSGAEAAAARGSEAAATAPVPRGVPGAVGAVDAAGGRSRAADALAGAAALVASAVPAAGRGAVEVSGVAGPGTGAIVPGRAQSGLAAAGIAPASVVDIVAESARYVARHFPKLLGASLLTQFIAHLDFMPFFLGPLLNGYTLMVARSLRERRGPELGDLTLSVERLPAVMVASWIGAILFSLGIVCFAVPGLVIGTWIMFTLPVLVERKTGIIAAFRESRRLVSWRGFWAHFWLFLLTLGIVGATQRLVPDLLASPHALGVALFLVSVLTLPLVLVPLAVAFEGAHQAVPSAAPKALPPSDPGARMPERAAGAAEAVTRVKGAAGDGKRRGE